MRIKKKSNQVFISMLILLIGIFLSLILFIYLNQEHRIQIASLNKDKNLNKEVFVLHSSLEGKEIEVEGEIEAKKQVDLIAGAEGFLFEKAKEKGDKIYKGQYVFRLTKDELGKKNQSASLNLNDLKFSLSEQEQYFNQQFDTFKNRSLLLKDILKGIGNMNEINYSNQAKEDFLIYRIKKQEKEIQRSRKVGQDLNIDEMLAVNWVRTPISGIITKFDYTSGQKINTGDRIMTVSDLEDAVISVKLPKKYYEEISFGLNAKIKLPFGEYEAVVSKVENRMDFKGEKYFKVELNFNGFDDNHKEKLLNYIGEKVEVKMELLAKPVFLAPKKYVLMDKNGSYVYVKGKKYRVEVVEEKNDELEIRSNKIKEGALLERVK